MYQRVKNFLDKNDILFIINKSQYSLREKHTIHHAAIDIVNIIQKKGSKIICLWDLFGFKKGL